ncbi:unnamed protein product [Adineta ricciae]|uniref:Uncharacterized protein n=1 Tax=Adineta ricciae TaxID=249248 RepID=A0A814FV17_ADIRI|nr:unnamed protein product [Adineta ricciae]
MIVKHSDDRKKLSKLYLVKSNYFTTIRFNLKQKSSTITNNASFFNSLHERFLINSFNCENDSPLAAGEYSFLVYGGQYLTLYNLDGQLHRLSWYTNIYDSIKQIRWSSYYRSYLIMTARYFTLFSLASYKLFPINLSLKSSEHLQLFTCHQTDLWLVCLVASTKQQILVQYDLSEWERNEFSMTNISLDELDLHRTDSICAIETDRSGECLALLIAERNQNLTVGMQRRRRLILVSTYYMSPVRVIYFSDADDLYWSMASVINRQNGQYGWLLSKWQDKELAFVNEKCFCKSYPKELCNLAVTIDGHYLILRTINSLDIYEID